jgi:hypothetical protein
VLNTFGIYVQAYELAGQVLRHFAGEGLPSVGQALCIVHIHLGVVDVDSLRGGHQGIQFSSLGGKPVKRPWLVGTPSSMWLQLAQ